MKESGDAQGVPVPGTPVAAGTGLTIMRHKSTEDRKITSYRQAPAADTPADRLFQRIERDLDRYTGAERAIASHMLQHRNLLAFETASSLAGKVGVSAVTVGRFCRMLGYKHYKALKNDLRDPQDNMPWLVGQQLGQFAKGSKGSEEIRESLQLEIAALAEVYAMAETPAWQRIVDLLAVSPTVYVAGFQTERGIGLLMGTLLQYVRRHVRVIDPGSGHYGEVFADGQPGCMVLFDVRRYSRQTFLLAKRCSEENLPLIIITDKFCNWASRFTPHVIALSTETGLFWSSHVAMTCTVNLLVNQVVARLGLPVEKRLTEISELHQTFTGYVGYPRNKSDPDKDG